ncbi:hypothetical protein SETIT_6G019000v2 [Setaria italica]|uniref:Uncharacterized protein n=2 Tax=Setaria TaxID=4554 RepID=K3YKE8_SETIT|nr:paired amphipathic helix protein Sin3-like 6 [Setaria viridis]RCV29505.1 hypothetical protein SETIT_6G019000v2 [Setaria italica]TKW08254.1 hypothetical protein SEVIR_6G017300v2 [Setaria viridis]
MGYTGGLNRDPPTPAPPVRVRLLPPPTVEACRFLLAVQREFADRPDKVDDFLAILLDYCLMRIEVPGVVERMQVVLQGYPDLVREFNTFLPWGYALNLDD